MTCQYLEVIFPLYEGPCTGETFTVLLNIKIDFVQAVVLIWNNIGTDFQTCKSLNEFKRQKLSSVFMIQLVLDTSSFFVSN